MIVDFRNMPGLENLVDMQALEGLQNKMIPGVNIPGGTNLAGNLGGVFQNIVNMANASQQQQPVLGPDDFGFYQIPVSDPTYRSGFDYARSIAGGIPMEQVIAPGVSYSPEMPMGYTQAQLNTAVGTTPTPPAREPDDPRYFGTGIGGVNIPIERDKKSARLRDIFGGSKNILPLILYKLLKVQDLEYWEILIFQICQKEDFLALTQKTLKCYKIWVELLILIEKL